MSKNVLNISVVGLGKIGLPLAVQFASKGHTVSGVDIDQRVVDLVNDAVEPFPGEHGLADGLRDVVSRGLLKAVTNYGDAIADSDVVVVVVPLFVDDDARPDFGWIDSATRSSRTRRRCRSAPLGSDGCPSWPRAVDSPKARTSMSSSHPNVS
jgi:UDP-N-acetyl-D-mannosaminuronate dehydrogenase